MRNQDDYRHHAAELVKLAQRAATSSDKGWLVLSAEAWLDLADRFDRTSERRALSLYLMAISCGSRYFVGGCGAALAVVSFIIGLEVSVATTGSGAEPSAEIARKGDRLPLVPVFHRKAVNQPLDIRVPGAPASELEMADNCESLVSSLAHSPLGHIAGRCLS
jgi:hypothetical protein